MDGGQEKKKKKQYEMQCISYDARFPLQAYYIKAFYHFPRTKTKRVTLQHETLCSNAKQMINE